MMYEPGKNGEQLVDLEKDPGEMKNVALDPDKKGVLEEHQGIFKTLFPK
jgi:hypothetical protein